MQEREGESKSHPIHLLQAFAKPTQSTSLPVAPATLTWRNLVDEHLGLHQKSLLVTVHFYASQNAGTSRVKVEQPDFAKNSLPRS